MPNIESGAGNRVVLTGEHARRLASPDFVVRQDAVIGLPEALGIEEIAAIGNQVSAALTHERTPKAVSIKEVYATIGAVALQCDEPDLATADSARRMLRREKNFLRAYLLDRSIRKMSDYMIHRLIMDSQSNNT